MQTETIDEPSTRDSSPNPYVFIVGCPRSGTTLLQRIVDSHPQIAIMRRETDWIPGYFKQRIGLTPEGLVTPELISQLLEYRTSPKLGIDRQQLEKLLGSGEPVSYARFVSGIFDVYGKAQGKTLAGDKSPGYCREIHLLHGLWPKAKFVHLIRDGRDVCLSANNWAKAAKLANVFATWSEDPITTAALWWTWHVRAAREKSQTLEPNLYYELRYESLVSHPADECARLCGFLGLPYDEAMLRFHEGHTRTKPGLDAKHAWLPITPGIRDWRSELPAKDLERFEAAAGELLDDLGYPRGVQQPRTETLTHVARIRDAFLKDRHLQQAALSDQ